MSVIANAGRREKFCSRTSFLPRAFPLPLIPLALLLFPRSGSSSVGYVAESAAQEHSYSVRLSKSGTVMLRGRLAWSGRNFEEKITGIGASRPGLFVHVARCKMLKIVVITFRDLLFLASDLVVVPGMFHVIEVETMSVH